MTKDHATGKVGLKRSFQDACPKWLYAGLITAFWVLHPRRPPRIILPHEDHWRVHHLATGALSCIPNRRQVNRGSLEKRNAKLDRYTFPGFADVEKGDTVLDVGAFIGEFTIPASVRAERVFSFEPDAVNFACLKHNTIHSSNVTARNLLAWNENERVDFHLGEDVSDHSVFDVDSHQVRESVSIKAVRLDTHLEPKGLSSIDFLKLDAEGAEPQVLAGMEDIKFRKCAIDCSAEYYGESTANEVVSLLREKEYEVRIGKPGCPDVVYGRL
jgi:FkbM family methyltransferase